MREWNLYSNRSILTKPRVAIHPAKMAGTKAHIFDTDLDRMTVPLGSLNFLLSPPVLNKVQIRGGARGARRNFHHSSPLSVTPVVQSLWAWICQSREPSFAAALHCRVSKKSEKAMGFGESIVCIFGFVAFWRVGEGS